MMTRLQYKFNFYGVIFFYVIALLFFFLVDPNGDLSKRLKNALPFFIVLPVGWLAECYRRRAAYQNSVMSAYIALVEDVQLAIHYTYRNYPKEDDYHAARMAISSSIDKLRAHFLNFKQKNDQVGLYPLEGIKTIYKWIEYVGYDGNWKGEEASEQTRSAIIFVWSQKVRDPLLNELDRFKLEKEASPYLGDKNWQLPPYEAFASER